MQIQYFGLSSFKITTKEAVIITDPFHKDSGLTPPRGAADVLILAQKNKALYSAVSGISGEHFDITDPGEYDVKGVTVTGIPLKQEAGYITIFLIESEDIRILNLTHIKEFNLKEEELEALGEIDILILPVGGNTVMSASTAAKAVNEVEPKIVIPSHYKNKELILDLDSLEKFVKEMGGKKEEMEKLMVKKKELQEEGTKLVILEALR
ncbi:MAG TPA: MBL fold metallo-hydrolase [Candidatus Limnocylindria bacterium]|nr:MBL fold metallo-hydrolase [Candidatus Limnocylindria bacterium]